MQRGPRAFRPSPGILSELRPDTNSRVMIMTSPVHPTAWLTGFIPDLPTPFDETGALDLKAFARLCERLVAAGMPALVVCDVAGEASTLSAAEQEGLIRVAADVARGRARVIAGAGSNSTSQAI